jgi:hypothetical protein
MYSIRRRLYLLSLSTVRGGRLIEKAFIKIKNRLYLFKNQGKTGYLTRRLLDQ